MAELTGYEILAKALRNEGVNDLFFIMGGPMLLAEESCIKEGIRPIDVRHEQAAAFMGQAYSRLYTRNRKTSKGNSKTKSKQRKQKQEDKQE